NDIRTGEHTGTHLDAPVHWATGKDGEDTSQIPAKRLIAPAAVIDVSDRVADNPDFLLEVDDLEKWQSEPGAVPGAGWRLVRTGWGGWRGWPGGVPNRGRAGPAPPRHLGRGRARAGGGGAGHRRGGREGGPRRGQGALVRPAVPVPLVRARSRQVRADAVTES